MGGWVRVTVYYFWGELVYGLSVKTSTQSGDTRTITYYPTSLELSGVGIPLPYRLKIPIPWSRSRPSSDPQVSPSLVLF